MLREEVNDDYLNMFIDDQLDQVESDELHERLAVDEDLRKRVCQLRAVRELVSYAYESLPAEQYESVQADDGNHRHWIGMVASILMVMTFGLVGGWMAKDVYDENYAVASTGEVFQYYKQSSPAVGEERKIILHVTTDDIRSVTRALDEAEQLLASYRQAGTPMKLDIITFKHGINMLRVGMSPYIGRLDDLLANNENVMVYACQRSIEKARKREGKDIQLMPQTYTARTGKELITERLEHGWIYIKV